MSGPVLREWCVRACNGTVAEYECVDSCEAPETTELPYCVFGDHYECMATAPISTDECDYACLVAFLSAPREQNTHVGACVAVDVHFVCRKVETAQGEAACGFSTGCADRIQKHSDSTIVCQP
jgi:hypothetical protein